MAAYEPGSGDLLTQMLERLESAASWVAERVTSTAMEAGEAREALGRFAVWALGGNSAVDILAGFAAVVAGGLLAEYGYRRVVGLPALGGRRQPDASGAPSAADSLHAAVLEIVGVLLSQAGAVVAYFALHQGGQSARRIVLTYVTSLVIVRVICACARLLLTPDRAAHRLIAVSDAGARHLRIQFALAAILAVFGFSTATLLRVSGAPNGAVSFILLVPYSAFFVIVAAMVVTAWAHPREGGIVGRRQAGLAFPLLYVLLVFALGQVALHLGHRGVVFPVIGSLLLGLVLGLVDGWLNAPIAADGSEGPGLARPAAERPVARTVLHLAGVLALLWLWGADLLSGLEAWLGEATVRAATKVVATMTAALLAWEVIKAFIDRRVGQPAHPAAPAAAGADEAVGAGASRLETLLPLLRKIALAFIVLLGTMTGLSAVGIDAGPLLAGAGVAGIAIGFGAQTLVQDVVSGAFFLIDDAFRMGEYIEVGQDRGRVEQISVRSLRLRHHRGPIVTIPFSEIKTLTNHSRDWAIIKLLFRFAFGTNPATVKRVVKQVSTELMEHPEYGKKFLEPLKSQGVRGTDEAGMVIGVKFMARPGEQFQLRREAYQRLLAAFEGAGLSLAKPQVVVQMPTDKAGDAAIKAAAAAALTANAAREDA